MESIGIDLYIKLVNKATAQIKKGILELHFMEKTTDIDLGISMYIPESYLPDINQRLLMYNKISSANSDKELKQIQIEMINRFGLLPLEIKNLFYTAELSIFAIDNNIEKISVSKNNLILKYSNYRKDKIFSKDVDLHKTIDLIKS